MTLEELEVLRDIINWAKRNVKSDGLYVRVELADKWIKRDIILKNMDPRKYAQE